MKRWKWLLPGLTLALGVVLHQGIRAQLPVKTREAQSPFSTPKVQGTPGSAVEIGPGEQGAVLRLPGAPMTPPEPEPTPQNQPVRQPAPVEPRISPNPALNGLPESIRNNYNPAVLPPGGAEVVRPATRVALPPINFDNVNRDIEVTPEAGPWVLMMMAYTGEKAPEYARKFTFVLRNRFKLNAFVFNFGAEEKRKEYERVNAEREKQKRELREALKDVGVVAEMPIRIHATRFEQQVGVLVGGFKTRDDALAAKERLRKNEKAWDSKDAIEFAFDLVYQETPVKDKFGRVVGASERKHAYDNPFLKAFPARNPTIKAEDPANERNAEEVKFMRRINESEPLSLFKCPKAFTLVIKQFSSQLKVIDNSTVDPKEQQTAFLKHFSGLNFWKKGEWQDYAAHNAHNLAEGLRKAGLPETYVLHCRHCSYVTVGGYDRVEDPQLMGMQNYLTTRFQEDAFRRIDIMARPAIMPIPK